MNINQGEVTMEDFTGYAQQAAIKQLAPREEAPLERILGRINALTGEASEIGQRLRAHADKALGERPEGDSNERNAHPVRSGAIGEIEDALDRLCAAHAMLRGQADRNCSLA